MTEGREEYNKCSPIEKQIGRACFEGDVNKLKKLLKTKTDYPIDVNWCSYEHKLRNGKKMYCTPLCIASKKGHYEIIKILAETDGIDFEKREGDGEPGFIMGLTPLENACVYGQHQAVRELLANGADHYPNLNDWIKIKKYRRVIAVFKEYEKNPKSFIKKYKQRSDTQQRFFQHIVINTKPNTIEWSKFALVIGMSKYKHFSTLDGPRNDCESFTNTLKKHNFDVTTILDCSSSNLTDKFKQFCEDVLDNQVMSKPLLVFVYFSGHGLWIGSSQCLVPVDFPEDLLKINKSITVREWRNGIRSRCVTVKQIVDVVTKMKGKLVIVLDCCRNEIEDFSQFSLYKESELAKSKSLSSPDYLIAMPTQLGSVSLDSDHNSKESLYTKYLVKEMDKNECDIMTLFRKTREKVYNETASTDRSMLPEVIDNQISDRVLIWPPK